MSCELPKFVDLTNFPTTPTLLDVLHSSGQPITGITILGRDVFVVRNTSQVYVYNSTNFTLTRNDYWIRTTWRNSTVFT